MRPPQKLKTWIEIGRGAVRKNIRTFRSLLNPKTKLMAVVKSNAYGHGITVFPKLAEQHGADGFCVDSVAEGARLRKEGIQKPIFVLGPTFPEALGDARENRLVITISTFEGARTLARQKNRPDFHLKVETGMNRQGMTLKEIPRAIRFIKEKNLPLKGIYTHFASAKDINYPTFTEMQFERFMKADTLFKKAGFKKLVRHAAATAGTLINKKYHLDWVRVGIGLYGLWPSRASNTAVIACYSLSCSLLARADKRGESG